MKPSVHLNAHSLGMAYTTHTYFNKTASKSYICVNNVTLHYMLKS